LEILIIRFKENSLKARILLLTRKNDSSMKQADLRDMFRKAYKVILSMIHTLGDYMQ
jgi:hypothetical protein